jgi:hypothetical protein
MVLTLAFALNDPSAQSLHTKSLLAVAPDEVYVPAAHLALTATQAALLSTAEYVEPTTQAVHWRSITAEPAADWP